MGNGRMRARIAALALGLALTLTACGFASNDGGSGGGDGAGEPVRIALLVEKKGESPEAVDDFADGFMLGVEELNEAGGIGGRPVEVTRFPAPNEPQEAIRSIQKGLAEDPAVMVGIPSTSMIRAALPQIGQTGRPFIGLNHGDLSAEEVEQAGGWLFQVAPSDIEGPIINQTIDHLAGEMGVTRIGVMYVDLQFGTEGLASFKQAATKAGVEIAVERSYPVDATDLTEQVLAMKAAGAEAVINWGYPNQYAVGLQQMLQNGIDLPVFGSSGVEIVRSQQLAPPEALENAYASAPCNPLADQPEWSTTFQEAYGYEPGSNAAFSHDIARIVKAAVEQAGSTDPEALRDALEQVTVTDGVVCAAEYAVDGPNHQMSHTGVLSHYTADTPETLATTSDPAAK